MITKTKAERRAEKKLKLKFAPKGATLAGQLNKIRTAKNYAKRKRAKRS
jgi:hypothetical protein